MRAEKILLYQTTFVTFWMLVMNVLNCVILYYAIEGLLDELTNNIMYVIVYICRLLANPGSLLFLFHISKTVRTEFHRTFRSLLCCFKGKNQVLPTSFHTVPKHKVMHSNRSGQTTLKDSCKSSKEIPIY